MKRRFKAVILLLFPLSANLLLATFVLEFAWEAFADTPWLCYFVTAVAAVAAVVIVGSLFLKDIGPLGALIALPLHGAALIAVFAGIYRGFGLIPACCDGERAVALYFSMVTWTTLGYGDFQPPPEIRLVAATEATLGYIFLGLMVGIIANLLIERSSGTSTEGPGR